MTSEEIMEHNIAVGQGNKANLRKLERDYMQEAADNLENMIEERKQEIIDRLVEYQAKMQEPIYDKYGEIVDYKTKIEPVVIYKYFFKSINPFIGGEPVYSSEKLGIAWEIYSDTIVEISMELKTTIVPTLSSFCKFAGIRLSTFRGYENSADESMRILTEKINDECYDNNVMLAQMGYIKETSTQFRMKSEQGRMEKTAPVVHIHADNIDLGQINDRLAEIKEFAAKKNEVIEGSKG